MNHDSAMTITKRKFLEGAATFAIATSVARENLHAAETAPAAVPDLKLDVGEGSLQLRPDGAATTVLRYAAAEPLLVVHAQQGTDCRVRLRNTLREATSFQLCGLRGLGQLDDPGRGPVAAGAEASLQFKPLDSGTAWFRPQFGQSDQKARGLAGVLIVDGPNPPVVDHDIVCFLTDWALDAENRLISNPTDKAVTITVGSRPIPTNLVVRPGARLRVRLVNGSSRRAMLLSCEGARPMIVAVDGQPSELFEPVRATVPLGPGARFDLMLDLPREAQQTVTLLVRGTDRIGGIVEPDRVISTWKTEGEPVIQKPAISALPPNPALPAMIPLERSKRAEITIATTGGSWSLNGVVGVNVPPAPVLRVKQGDVVTFGFTNASKALVGLNLYGQAMRILHAKDDGWEPYWRDSVLLPPGIRTHVAFMADKPGQWPIESGFSAQAEAGLRGWFEVSPA